LIGAARSGRAAEIDADYEDVCAVHPLDELDE
jgi:hypothetical protein